MSAGTLVLGLLNGLTVGLLAVGLVLVYKSNRFLNLAHAQLGALSALLLGKWVVDWGWNWWVAFVVSLAVGVVTGIGVERLFIRPVRRRGGSPIRLLLMSLAVSQVLLGLTFIPYLSPDPSKAQTYPQPFTAQVHIGSVVLNGMWVLTAVLVPVLVVCLALFMRYSLLGRKVRAAANNAEAARLCGISVERVSALTWAMAGGLSALSAILQAPTQPTFNIAALGPYLLMLTLGAAAFGAFVSLPWALGGGIVLGVISQVVTARTNNASNGELAVFATILLVVLVRGRVISRVFAAGGRVVDALPTTRVPESLRTSLLVRYQRLGLGAIGLVAALVVPMLPYFRTEGHRFLLVLVLLYALLGIALTMLVGWSGQVSLGHFGIVGLAAYLTARWADQRWDFLAIVLVAGLIGAAVMVLIGAPALRVGGLTLAVTTMGFAVIAHDWLYHQSWAGSRQPFVAVSPVRLGPDLGTPFSQLSIYAVALGVLVIGVVGAGYLRRLGPGRLAIAVRDNENAASAFGLVPATIKLTILAVSGFYAAVAGVIWAMAWRSATALQFSPDFSVALVAIPVIGGLGSIGGAVVAAVIVYATAFFVGPLVSGLFGDFGNNLGFQLMLAGVGQVTVLLSYPNGIAGLAQGRWQAYLDHRARSLDARSTESATATEAHAAPEPAATPAIASSIAATNGAAATAWEVGEVRSRIARRADWRTDPDAPALVTRDVRVRFGGVVALDDASITVEEGQIVGLIGPNGAGKTTLMNVISGMQRADAGSVRLFGCEVSGLPPDFRTALGVARTFQDAKLFAGLTVTETLQIALAYRNKVGTIGAMVAAPWVRAAEWSTRSEALQVARRFGLLPWADALTQDLSTGTRRICDLAAQVAARPKLLLLDEPTAGVAQREAEAFRPLLRGIRDELGCAVLIVEHDMPLLMGLCDRVYAMEAGQVVAEGTPDEIRHDPVVIASYLGSSDVAIARSGAR